MQIYTMSHSTRPITAFIDMLRGNAVERLVDIRNVPRSRHNPQYNGKELAAALGCARLSYRYMPGLGDFRQPIKVAITNLAWRNMSFRG